MAKKAEITKKEATPNEVAKVELTPSTRFTNTVMREYSGKAGSIELSSFQTRLIQNYFIGVDTALKMAEDKRLKKPESKRDSASVTWKNINMESLAIQVVACSRIGFDPGLPNHINMVPYKNNTTGKYDIVFIEGYRGKELKAKKYGFDVPDKVIIEIVFETDVFIPIKRDSENDVENYEFKITKPFDRGGVLGGFYYHLFTENPEKNRLMIYNLAEIEKRKPKYASAEFWGGDKTVWKNGKPAGKEHVEGWFLEMIFKTIFRLAYDSITIDSKKVDDDFMQMVSAEKINSDKLENRNENLKNDSARTIESNANQEEISMPEDDVQDAEEVQDEREDKVIEEAEKEKEPKAKNLKAPPPPDEGDTGDIGDANPDALKSGAKEKLF